MKKGNVTPIMMVVSRDDGKVQMMYDEEVDTRFADGTTILENVIADCMERNPAFAMVVKGACSLYEGRAGMEKQFDRMLHNGSKRAIKN